MSKARSFIKYWLPVIVWMSVIFSASGDALSSQHTSRILGPLIHWLFPGLSRETVGEIVFVIRKAAHLTEYAVLAVLLWRAARKPIRHDSRPWQWTEARIALGLAALYAATDELHQVFVPNRQGRLLDVLLDTTGAALGLLLLWVLGFYRKHRSRDGRRRAGITESRVVD